VAFSKGAAGNPAPRPSRSQRGSSVSSTNVQRTAARRPAAAESPNGDVRPVIYLDRITGSVAEVDHQERTVQLVLDQERVLPTGTIVKVYREYLTGEEVAEVLRVTESSAGIAIAKQKDKKLKFSVKPGDSFKTILPTVPSHPQNAG
jgi:hypothetical protein